jgi:pyruvate kinase
VSLSFINDKKDVRELLNQIKKYKKNNIGLVLKIETRSGFMNLPSILFEAMKHHKVGVMIARGDLAVEIGFERLAEVQEEILWLCEAAHIPVIWATQVLENLAKTGLPSRAEVTDAAMSGRAEAVMLNKGPFIHKAVGSLVNILKRMNTHQNKKRSLLKALSVCKVSI